MPGEKIFVVEDETIVALDIQHGLRKLGYAVSNIAISGEEAIARVPETHPDLILMDIRLKGEMDGIEAAIRIHQSANVPIIFLTAYADESTLHRAKQAAPFAYLLKPFEERVLATTIEIALHNHRLQAAMLNNLAIALHESKERYRQLIHTISDQAIALLDGSGRIVDWNPGAERIFGYSPTEIIGKHIASLFPPESVSNLGPGQLLGNAKSQGRSHEQFWHLRKDHTKFWGDTTIVALKEQQGDVFSFLTVTREMFA
jgi:PAS domain S-box-containing protein